MRIHRESVLKLESQGDLEMLVREGSLRFSFPAQRKKGTCTVGRCCLRGRASSVFAVVCETYKMTGRFIFLALCLAISLATASAALGQSVRPGPAETPGPRPIARTEARKI